MSNPTQWLKYWSTNVLSLVHHLSRTKHNDKSKKMWKCSNMPSWKLILDKKKQQPWYNGLSLRWTFLYRVCVESFKDLWVLEILESLDFLNSGLPKEPSSNALLGHFKESNRCFSLDNPNSLGEGGDELFFHTLHSLERGYPYHCCEWWKQDKPDPLMVPAHWPTDGKPDPLHNKIIKIKSLQIIQSLYCILNSLESDHRFRLSDALKVEHKMPHRLVKKHMLTCPENLDFLLL